MEPVVLFSVSGVTVYAGHLLLIVAALLCLLYSCVKAKRCGAGGGILFAVLVPVLGVFFARLCYCLCRFSYTLHEQGAGSFFAFWKSGHMVYGGMLGVILAAWITGRIKNVDWLRLLDCTAPAGMLFIAAVRLAEGLSGQGYGAYLEEESVWARFPFAVFDPYYEEWAWALFLLMALAALAICALVVFAASEKRGDAALISIGLYAALQIVLESLRRDEFLRWGFVRCNQVFSAILVALVLLAYALASGDNIGKKVGTGILSMLLLVSCLAMEFAMEQRIRFLQFLSVDACYIVSAVCCILLCLCICIMRLLSASHIGKEA